MNFVYDIVAFVYMWNTILIEVFCVLVHVKLDFLKWKWDWLLYFMQVLDLLDLIHWKLILLRIKDAFITKHFLSLFFSNYLMWTLFSSSQTKWSLIKSERVKELCLPIRRIKIHLKVPLLPLYIAFGLFTFLRQISLVFFFLFIRIQFLSVFFLLVEFLKTLVHS